MVCIFDLNSFPVLNNFQVIFGLYQVGEASDREAWRKLVSLVLSVKYDEHFCVQAFPLSGTINVGAETRKYQIDSAIMATVILDLQPFNQVNRYKSYMCGKIV